MGQAVSDRTPEPGVPRLRFIDISPGTPEWISAHEGAMKLGQGAAQAIRNLATHDLTEPDEREALEMLAVLSYVTRLVDGAEVVKAPEPFARTLGRQTWQPPPPASLGTAWQYTST
jgi:hypothetical protein